MCNSLTDTKLNSITLIGMPGSGKSMIGKLLTKRLGFRFIDGDKEIEKRYPDRQKFLDRYGDKAYIKMEEKTIIRLPLDNCVLAPGGSVVYSRKLMDILKKSSVIVFLDLPYKIIEKRLTNKATRGIVNLKSKSLKELYNERHPLYKKWSDITINCSGKSNGNIINEIVERVRSNMKIKYYSTNHKSDLVDFKDAILQGQAPDKGLYMPKLIPTIDSDIISSMKRMSYPEIAFVVMNEFLKNDIPENYLKRMTREAYNYDVPVEHLTEKVYILRLDQGPTASFKDFAARMMARLMNYFIKKDRKKLLILVATSGDTGSAVANAFYGLENIKMIILFPKEEVTELQRKQMTTLGNNIIALSVDGKFDDCQSMVKQAFVDPELKYLNLSSANSINFGRLLPQTVYYFYAYSRLARNNEKVVFSVPSGNFGNLVGGLIAKRMGLPVHKFIAAVNANDEFPEFLKSGEYIPIKPSRRCISNAMNVGHPSNLARLVDLYGGQMDEKGKINRMPDMNSIKRDVFSLSVSDDETRKTIKYIYNKHKVILEPHGAVGLDCLKRFLPKTDNMLCVCLETAHPAKFPEELERLGIKTELPKSMKKLEVKKEMFENIPANYSEFKRFLKEEFY